MNHLPTLPPSVAIIGLAGRFPGARTVEQFWRNLCAGVETITFFSDDELEQSPLLPHLPGELELVKARGILDDTEYFDAAFFGYSHREAEVIDPQQRHFLECSWEALEDAGYDPETCDMRIGVYAGASFNRYLLNNLVLNRELIASFGALRTLIANDKDFLPTRVSYKLNLKGPSINVQTACSTSLVAVHVACQGLLNGECDLALAGGASIRVPLKAGYPHQSGSIASPDGHCRAFDVRAQGTVFSDGVGIVVLKRLEDAMQDGDQIWAVIRGSAVNNDGSAKIGFTAPSVDSQAEVVAEALAVAQVSPDTVTFVEAHGTGTELGDPIEVAALTRAFRTATERRGYCALGSVKTNVGHLDAAAGVAGLIKTALAARYGLIPPSLHFERPNPKLELDTSPFYVNTSLAEWRPQGMPRRAGVSSLGVGGTNVHVIVEQAPAREPSGPGLPWQLLVLSARSADVLERAAANLAAHLRHHPDLPLADVACTLQRGRRAFDHRRVVVCRDREEAAAALAGSEPGRVLSASHDGEQRPVVFMFPGQGAQHVGMGAELYRYQPTFREEVDQCAELLRPHLGLDLRRVLRPAAGEEEEAAEQLAATRLTQPALFVVEYALARLWMEWGIRPTAMIGHSIGEYVAACLAGVLNLQDALTLVAARGRLMQELPAGAMLSVPLAEAELLPLLADELSLAAVNGPARCVVSGPASTVAALEERLAKRELSCRRLRTSHAFHSAMMEPIQEPLTRVVEKLSLAAPKIPYVANLTGARITAREATDPGYWGRHLRQTVRFAAGLSELLADPRALLLEVGPGTAMSTLARQHPERGAERWIVSSLGHPRDESSQMQSLLLALGRLWLAGAGVDWRGFQAHEQRHRVSLPTYPFARRRYWVEPQPLPAAPQLPAAPREAPAGGIGMPPPPPPAASQHPRPALQTAFVAPRNETEQRLAEDWQALLGVDQVGIHDDYFELGGDSIIGLQLVIRAARSGLRMTVKQLLDFPTIAELAPLVERLAGPAEEGPVVGPVALTPIQHWFFQQDLPAPHHFNHTLRLEVREPLRTPLLEQALARLIDHHDALRLRFHCPGGQWQQVTAPADGATPFAVVDLSALSEQRLGELLATVEGAVETSLDLEQGPIVRLVLCDLGAAGARLLLTAHHLAVDYLSWPILAADLWTAYSALNAGREVELAPKTTSFQRWVGCLSEQLSPTILAAESTWWLSPARQSAAPLPVDFPARRRANTVASVRSVTRALSEPDTQALLRHVPAVYRTRTEEVLLAALVLVLDEWTGAHLHLVDVEGRGREVALEGVDLSRTVGWFTTMYPLLVDSTKLSDPGQVLARVKEECRRVPMEGLGYGLLRYSGTDRGLAERLAALPPAEILFSYVGELGPALVPDLPLVPASEPLRSARDPRGRRRHPLEVSSTILNGRLQTHWAYSCNVHRRETIERLAEALVTALRSLIDHCRSLTARRYTPSDFPEAGMNQTELDELLAELTAPTE